MQPSNLHGGSDRLDQCIEEICWENGQLFAAHLNENTEREKWTASTSSYILPEIALQSTEEHSLKVVNVGDEKIGEDSTFATGDDLTDLLDDLESKGSVGITRNTLPPCLPRPQSYAHSTEVKRGDSLQHHMPPASEGLEDLARLCPPILQSAHLSVGARGRSVVPPLTFNIPQDDLSKLSDAVLNRISAQCMGSSLLQSMENTVLNQSAGDAVNSNAPHINPVVNLLSSSNATSNATSRSSIDISTNSDLDSILLDSNGSGFTPGNGGKPGEVAWGKKARAIDDLDSDSEGSLDEIGVPQKPRQEQGPSSKRMRAAEIHNEAERKRRGKINEKLKALQELIPNANKTDKASVLTEAIDYLQKLRLQLQMMCCRNGLVTSPFPVSQEVQNPQINKEEAVSNVNIKIGAAQGASVASIDVQRFPLMTSMAAKGCSIPLEVPPFNEASFSATTFASPLKGNGHEFNTNSSQQVPFSHPFQGIT